MKHIPNPRYHEVYRGIGFHITMTGFMVMDEQMPPCRDCVHRSWGSFASEREARDMCDFRLPDSVRIQKVRDMIDRAIPLLAEPHNPK